MASEHPVFKAPSDPKTTLWRYMDFTKYVALLESEKLFFARADTLGDPHEGSVSSATVDLRRKAYQASNQKPNIWDEVVEEVFLKRLSAWFRDYTKLTFVNCWHMNSAESDAMWRLYAPSGMGVAITTTFEKFYQLLPDNVFCGRVEYVDYATTPIPDENTFGPFIFKRISFEHEHELRAVVQHQRTPKGPVQDLPLGTEVPLSLNELIDAIYVSPRAPAWYADLVRNITSRYGLKKRVQQSQLDSKAIF